MHFSNNCTCCTMHSNEVLKSLQIPGYAFDGDLYIAKVTLAFLRDIENVHFFCTKKPKPVLGQKLKPVWTNRLRPKDLREAGLKSAFHSEVVNS